MTKSIQTQTTFRGRFAAFLILIAISIAILLAGLVLGIEPRLVMERTGDRLFRVTVFNLFAGQEFFKKTVEGINDVKVDDAVRDGRRDSAKEDRRRRRQKHLELIGPSGASIRWDRESDYSAVGEFMRGQEPSLSLAEPLPIWRTAIAWFCIVLGTLSFIGAIQSSFFPKKNAP